MKKCISFMIAIVLSFVMITQAYCVESNEEINNDVQESGATYLNPKADSTTVINDKLKLIYGLKQGISEGELMTQYIEFVDGVRAFVDRLGIDVIDYASENIGTGVKLIVHNSLTDEKIDEYSVLISGDVDGDGYFNGMDAVIVSCINNSLLPASYLNSEYYIAADCNKNGQIDEFDCDMLESAGLFLEDIDQTFINESFEKKHTVKFVDYDGTTILASEEVYDGTAAKLPVNPTKSGTTFLGWSGNYTNVFKDEIVKAIYKDDENVFMVSNATGNVGSTVSVLVSVDGAVDLCGFDITLHYDSDLELVLYDEDLDLDVIANPNRVENGIKLNFSSNTNKTKQRDIIEAVFRIKNTDKEVLPITISLTSAKKSVGKDYLDINYSIVNGGVYVNG